MIFPADIENFEKIEVIERPDDYDQFEEDIRNSEDGELKDRDQFKRWAIFYKNNIVKICYYPYHIKN